MVLLGASIQRNDLPSATKEPKDLPSVADTTLIAEIAVAAPLDTPLTYAIPAELADSMQVGVRVRVPLGRRTATGYVLAVRNGDHSGLKPVQSVLDTEPLFGAPWAEFVRRAAAYYRHPIGATLRSALPAGLAGTGNDVTTLTEHVYRPTERSDLPRGSKQQALLTAIRAQGDMNMTELRAAFAAPHAALQALTSAGYLTVEDAPRRRDPFRDIPVPADRRVVPSADQAAALATLAERLATGQFGCALLHGVTGSGKTEVYLQLIEATIAAGRQALVLVPEIALTPQLVGRFRARFANSANIAVLHSGLSEGERYDAWRSICAGSAQIVIGARSAVFAPLRNPGVIVVDEEHETSYKQSEGFRYHARDLALLRAQHSGTLVLLGSATPSPGVYRRARAGDFTYLPLTGRAGGQPLPQVTLVDMREADRNDFLSPPLTEAIAATLGRGEQTLLLLNRRGYSPYVICAACGHSPRCPNCAITLTLHRGQNHLRCHYCDFEQRPPEACPVCNSEEVMPEGIGTERLALELVERFPQARIARMDRDTTGRKGAHQRLVDDVLSGRVDILVGTQMVAKGHDFPRVTLVGVLNADSTLNFPDFRSAERTFCLLAQVAGRAGRGERKGEVLVQTYSPEHYALQAAATHDYAGFYAQEMGFREPLGYPPFGHLVNLVFAGNDPVRVQRAADNAITLLQHEPGSVEVLGPAPCPLALLRGKTRCQILLKAPTRLPLHRLLQRLDKAPALPGGVRLSVDVDPIDML